MQVKSGTIFDNFLITNDPNLAEEVGNETWGKTKVSPKVLSSAFKKTHTGIGLYPAHLLKDLGGFILTVILLSPGCREEDEGKPRGGGEKETRGGGQKE